MLCSSPMNRTNIVSWLTCLSIFLPACQENLNVPTTSLVSCQTSSDCPPNLVCNSRTQRCVSAADIDTLAPALTGTATVSPDIGIAGTSFTVEFTTNKSGVTAAVAFLDGSATLTLVSTDTQYFTFSYVALGTEGDGAHPLKVTLTDAAGNSLESQLGVSLDFDFTPPAVMPGSASLQLNPAATNPLRTVTAATVGTDLVLAFTASEVLSTTASPLVTATEGASNTEVPLQFELEGQSGTGYLFGCTYPCGATAPPDGLYSITVKLTDVAGNVAISRHRRLVHGHHVPAFQPYRGDSGGRGFHAGPVGEPRLGWSTGFLGEWSSRQHDRGIDSYRLRKRHPPYDELGRSAASDNSPFGPIALSTGDRAVVYIAAADDAGNLSTVVPVHDIDWVATMGNKVIGSTLENPNVFGTMPWLWGSLNQNGVANQLPRARTWQIGVDPWRLQAHHGGPKSPYGRPVGPRICGDGLRQCPRRDRSVWRNYDMAVRYRFDDTWEWNGQTWTMVTPTDPEGDGNPSARSSMRWHLIALVA